MKATITRESKTSSLLKLAARALAFINRTTPDCVMVGHDIVNLVGDHLVFQKDQQPKRDWYSGELMQCRRKGCSFEKFYGVRHPWKTDRADASQGGE